MVEEGLRSYLKVFSVSTQGIDRAILPIEKLSTVWHSADLHQGRVGTVGESPRTLIRSACPAGYNGLDCGRNQMLLGRDKSAAHLHFKSGRSELNRMKFTRSSDSEFNIKFGQDDL
jgi:hypothetical protein